MSDFDSGSAARKGRLTRLINDALEEMHTWRANYRRKKIARSVTVTDQERFQSAVIAVYDELLPLKGDCKEKWEEYSLDKLPELAEAENVRQITTTEGGRRRTVEQREPVRIPCRDLVKWSWALDDVAGELGFKADTEEKVADPADAIV